MSNAISNLDDQIDSRDVIARIEELEAELNEEHKYVLENKQDAITNFDEWLSTNTSDDTHEYIQLKKLAEQGEQYADDWEYGVQLINENYFETVMDEMIAECYPLPKDLPFWMTITYDYDALKQDYTHIDFDGQTYYVR